MRVRDLSPVSKMAVEYDAEAFASGPLADALFREQRAETFREGYIFRLGLNLKGPRDARPDWGFWACDIADHDRLAWSDRVYDLFGLPAGVQVDREWAV